MCGTGERSPFSLCEALDRTEPVAWRLLGPQKSLQETEEEPGYYVPHLWFRVDDEHLLLMDADLLLNKYWLYNLQVLEVNGSRSVWYRDSRIAIREVPHDLVYNCRLCITAKAYFQAFFTSLAGEELLCTDPAPLPDVLRMEALSLLVKNAARAAGQLQSQNQRVFIFVNGSTELLNEHTVLWNRDLLEGWLQCGSYAPACK